MRRQRIKKGRNRLERNSLKLNKSKARTRKLLKIPKRPSHKTRKEINRPSKSQLKCHSLRNSPKTQDALIYSSSWRRMVSRPV